MGTAAIESHALALTIDTRQKTLEIPRGREAIKFRLSIVANPDRAVADRGEFVVVGKALYALNDLHLLGGVLRYAKEIARSACLIRHAGDPGPQEARPATLFLDEPLGCHELSQPRDLRQRAPRRGGRSVRAVFGA